jgi:hypothetical protein
LKLFKEIIDEELDEDLEIISKDGKKIKVTKKELLVKKMIYIMLKDLRTEGKLTNEIIKAFELVRDTIGEKPVQQIEQKSKVEFEKPLSKKEVNEFNAIIA